MWALGGVCKVDPDKAAAGTPLWPMIPHPQVEVGRGVPSDSQASSTASRKSRKIEDVYRDFFWAPNPIARGASLDWAAGRQAAGWPWLLSAFERQAQTIGLKRPLLLASEKAEPKGGWAEIPNPTVLP